MFVCVCLAVSENVVRETIAGGAHDRESVTRACGAGGDCGACHAMIEDMIEDHLEANASGPRLMPGCPKQAERAPEPQSEERLVRAEQLVRPSRGRAA